MTVIYIYILYIVAEEIKNNLESDSIFNQSNPPQLHKLQAEYPSSTPQGIQSSTTGSFHGSFSLRQIFGNQEIKEDSIIYEISKAGYNQRFFGYHEWLEKFPNLFKYSFSPMDNIEYIENNKNITEEEYIYFRREVYPYINNTEDIFWIHSESIDKAYHHARSKGTLLSDSIKLTTKIILDIYKEMNNDTLFIIYGDHGCREITNEHGGRTESELGTALIILSKYPLATYIFGHKQHKLSKYQQLLLSYLPTFKHQEMKYIYSKEVFFGSAQKSLFNNSYIFQIDLASTLSYIFGVPIPHNSLGKLIPQVIPYREGITVCEVLLQMLFEYFLSLLQVNNLLEEYTEHGIILESSRHLNTFKSRLKSLRGNLLHLFKQAEKFINLEEIGIIEGKEMLDHELVSYISLVIDVTHKVDHLIRDNASYFRGIWLVQDYSLLFIVFVSASVFVLMLIIWSINLYIWKCESTEEETNLFLSGFPKPLLLGKSGIVLILLIFIFLVDILNAHKITAIIIGIIFFLCLNFLLFHMMTHISSLFPPNTKTLYSIGIFLLVGILKIVDMPSTCMISELSNN